MFTNPIKVSRFLKILRLFRVIPYFRALNCGCLNCGRDTVAAPLEYLPRSIHCKSSRLVRLNTSGEEASRLASNMTRALIDIYADELRFLIALKQSVGILNNRIHDKLSLIAIEKLRGFHPAITDFPY